MRLCCDESIKRSITNLFDQEGYDVVRVQDELELGYQDSKIIDFCRESERLLLTNDDDFFSFGSHPGILFLHEQRASPRDVVTAVQRIDRAVDTMREEVWHVPDGWV